MSSETMLPKTIIHVVTYNETTVEPCINSMLEQEGFTLGENFEIFVSYNIGLEQTWLDLQKFKNKITLFKNDGNYGFAKGHNVGIEKAINAGAKYVLVANADLKLDKNFLKNLVSSLESDSSAGLATPRLYRANADLSPVEPATYDATGMFFTKEIRHLDRASQDVDKKDYREKEYVFGATGAAMLLKKSFIEDAQYDLKRSANENVSKELELFDNSFFVYREDADLCWRAQGLGWNCIYEPSAIAHHVRLVLPERRSELPREYNLNGVRNRFLMQISNVGITSAFLCTKGFIFRNLLVIAACLIKERSSLNGILDVFKLFPNAWRKRKHNFSKRRKSELDVINLFNKKSFPTLKQKESKLEGITAVIINYNSGNRINSCVESTLKALEKVETNTELILVDNNSKEFDYKNDKIKIIKSDKNLGFAGAINHVAKNSSNSALMIINPDINVESNCINNLFLSLKSYSNLGSVGANLINKDGSIQKGFTARKFPTLLSTCFEIIGLAKLLPQNLITKNYLTTDNLILEKYLSRIETTGPNCNLAFIVDQPAGACLMIRKEAFNQINGFSEDYFPAWFEDVDFCKRLKQANWLCAVDAKAEAIHEGGYSLNTMTRPEFFSIWYKNLIRYWKIHGKAWERIIIKIFIFIGLSLRAVLSFIKSLKGNDINKNEAKEYFKVLSRL